MRTSLRASGSARTVLLRMAADQERADRIRALKQERPDLTWRRIADYVGVTERSATDWQKKGGIEFDNAKKLAELFEVDVEYIWRGAENGTPSPFAGTDSLADKLDLLLANQVEMLTRLDALERAITEGTLPLNDETAERLRRFGRAVVEGQSLEEAVPGPQPGRAPRRGAAKKRAAKSRTL